MPSSYVKDPDAKLDYSIDWRATTDDQGRNITPWLAVGETISTAVWTITGPDSVLVQTTPSPSITDGKCTIWLSGGTLGGDYTVTCHITTSLGRIDDRSFGVTVQQR